MKLCFASTLFVFFGHTGFAQAGNLIRRRLNHCDPPSPGSAVALAAPPDGGTTTVTGALPFFDETDTYVMEAKAGCTYTFSFCPADGGATGADDFLCDSNVREDAPWAQVWDAAGFFSLSGCTSTSDTCTDGTGARVGAITVWTAIANEGVLIGVDAYCGGVLDSYTLAVTAQGVTCGSGGGGGGGCTSGETSDDSGDCSETSDDGSD